MIACRKCLIRYAQIIHARPVPSRHRRVCITSAIVEITVLSMFFGVFTLNSCTLLLFQRILFRMYVMPFGEFSQTPLTAESDKSYSDLVYSSY